MTLPTRKIGPFSVSAIGLGCMNLSHAYGEPVSEDEGARLLNHALDAGVSFLDTAALYGRGENERLLGKAVMHRRGEFILASKCVLDMFDGKRGLDGSPGAIAKTLDGTLERLGTDHIDLYYLHRLDRRVPIEDSVGALARKSGCTPAQLALAWVLARGDEVVPIPGTRRIAHLEEDLGTLALTLDPTLFDEVDAIIAAGAILGPRYSAAMQAQIDTETLPGEELATAPR